MQKASSPLGSCPSHRTLAILLLFGLGAIVSTAGAAEIVVQNDSVAAPGLGTPANYFIPGERVAVWLMSPSAGKIVGVQNLTDSSDPAVHHIRRRDNVGSGARMRECFSGE